MKLQSTTYRIIAVARVQEQDELTPDDVAEIFIKSSDKTLSAAERAMKKVINTISDSRSS